MCHSGDVGDYRDMILNGVDDLTTVTHIEAHVTKGSTVATLEASVVDAIDRQIRIELGSEPTDWLPAGPDTGEWLGQVEVEFSDGTELTWPAGGNGAGFFSIKVIRELG